MNKNPIVLYTDHSISKSICYYFAKGSNSLMCHVKNFKEYDKTIATYGFKRGTASILNKVKNFYYIDHGYFNQSKRGFSENNTTVFDLNGYFRIVNNDFWHNGKGNKPGDRLDKLNIDFKKINKNGKYIILSEPSSNSINFFKLNNWTKDTKKIIKKYTDRKIIIHSKSSPTPLSELLTDAWCFVSNHSTAGLKAMIQGVPAYFTNSTLSNIGAIEDIEKHQINYSIFNNLAYGQWTIKEIESGEAWQYISKDIN